MEARATTIRRAIRVMTRDEAFADLAANNTDAAYRLAAIILGDAEEAEDAVQEAALAAWRSRELVRDPERLGAWFTRIVVNECRDRLRARRRRPVIHELVAEDVGQSAGSDDADALATRDALARALHVLEPDEQIAIVLRYWQDLTIDGIALATGVPSGTVKSRLHHALRRLRAAVTVEDQT